MIKEVKYVSFELSNICNLSQEHYKCPLFGVKEKKILKTFDVIKLLHELRMLSYKGTIGFNVYNEPMADPRLYYLLDYTRSLFGLNVKFNLWTNGFFLNQDIIDELWDLFKVEEITITNYNQQEYNFSRTLLKAGDMYLHGHLANMDNRLKYYEGEEIECGEPCFAPYNELIIKHNGDVTLCCLDWKHKYVFGNIHSETLRDIIIKPEMIDVYNKLKEGSRSLDICRRCPLGATKARKYD